jgi:hypothetical protein
MVDKKSGPGADEIMSPAEMKPLLAKSKQEPVSCVIGLTKNKDGVVLLDKKMKPKQLLAELKKKAAKIKLELDAPSLRFGRAHVDTEQDSGLVQFVVNKDAGGAMRPKLLEHLKKAGFGKLEIAVDAGFEAEPADNPEADAPAEPAPPATAQPAPPAAAPPPPAAGPAAGPDAGALTKQLTDLVKRMIPTIAADPGRADGLKSLAVKAQSAIKSADLAGAADAVAALRSMLDGAAPPGTASASQQPAEGSRPAPPPAPSPTIAKARLAWVATRQKVEGDLGNLHGSFAKAFKGHGMERDLTKAFRARVDTVLGTLDETLAHKLDAVNSATDPAQRAKLVQEAHATIQTYNKHVASDPTIAALDKNPFVPLSIQKTMTATLSALAKSIS